MNNKIIFIGVGSVGDKTAIELSRIYESFGNDIFYGKHGKALQYFQIHSFTNLNKVCLDVEDKFIILAGSIGDPSWQEARKTLSEQKPYLLLTIGTGFKRKVNKDSLLTFNNECLVFPDPLLVVPVEIAQLVLQIFFMHMPWSICQMGSIIGYDLADTKQVFEGKVVKVRKMTSDKEYYRENFSKFLNENKKHLSGSQGILMSLWGKNKELSISTAMKLGNEMESLIMSGAHRMITFHVLPKDRPDFMAIIFMALPEVC